MSQPGQDSALFHPNPPLSSCRDAEEVCKLLPVRETDRATRSMAKTLPALCERVHETTRTQAVFRHATLERDHLFVGGTMRPRILQIILVVVALCAASFAQAAHYSASVTLNGANEVPPNGSTSTGQCGVSIDTNANTLTYHLTYTAFGTPETAAHIHGFAPPGMNAGVIVPIPAGTTKDGVWNYLEAQEPNILAGLTYFNVHSMAFPGGEIRGWTQPVLVTDTPATTSWSIFALAASLLAGAAFAVRRAR